MPYIKSHEREVLDAGSIPQTVGHLTYLYTMVLVNGGEPNRQWDQLEFLTHEWIAHRGLSFTTLAQIMGALTATKMEYNRRLWGRPRATDVVDEFLTDFYTLTVAPYEDRKIAENGDVYTT